MSDETILYVIRHGETEWNANGRWQGFLDVPLNEVGLQQAHQLAHRLVATRIAFDAIYSSDLTRAFKTAQIVAEAQGQSVSGTLTALREINVGSWSGLNTDEIRARFGDDLARIDAGEDIKRGGGESFGDLVRRIAATAEELAATHYGQKIALFTHGGCVRALYSYIQQTDGQSPTWFQGHIGNTSINIFYRGPHGWRVGRLNDLTHLERPALTPDDAEKGSEHQV